MKNVGKIFVPDLAGDVTGAPGKGVLKLSMSGSNAAGQTPTIPPKIVSNVRFNKFQSRDSLTHFIDGVNTAHVWSFQRGIPDDDHKSIDGVGELTNRELYKSGSFQGTVLSHTNFAGSTTKMIAEYTQRAVSFGLMYQPGWTFVGLKDASAFCDVKLPNETKIASESTFMFRIMVEPNVAGTTVVKKSVWQITDATGPNAALTLTADGSDGDVDFNVYVRGVSGYKSQGLPSPSKIKHGQWCTVFIGIQNVVGTSFDYELRVYDMVSGHLLHSAHSHDSSGYALKTLVGVPRVYMGYGESTGGVNADYRASDFIEGVHVAEFAAWRGVLSPDDMDAIAKAHLAERQYKSGIDSRPVKRVQQIFDTMDSYPASPFIMPEKEVSISPYNSENELNFGSFISGTLQELMVYPEMLPARLYSGSGGIFYNASYFPYSASLDGQYRAANRIPLKDGQFRDIHDTPFEFRLLATGTVVPHAAHKETLLLNKVQIASGTFPSNTMANTVLDALGGAISPFNDAQASADSSVIDEIAVRPDVYPGLDQRLGDAITIEIPIPTIEDAVMGVDALQGRIASMAYYNVAEKRWDRKFMPGVSGSNIRAADQLWGENGPSTASPAYNSFWKDARSFLLNSCSIGFAGTSGFSIFSDEGANALMDLSTRGRPTSMYGFPHTDQYVAESTQTINIADYINEPFLLEKISVEFDAEVEEAGPGSIATHIKTPGRWKQATQWYKFKFGANHGVTKTKAGVPGASMFYRSYESFELGNSTSINWPAPDPPGWYNVVTPNVLQISNQWPRYGAAQETLGLADSAQFGFTPLAQLTAQAHMSPFPTFVGGSTRPAYAEFFDVYENEAPDVAKAGSSASNFYKEFIWNEAQVNKGLVGSTTYGHGFPISIDRLFAIQDTSNDPGTYSGIGHQQWRGWYNESNAHTAAIGNPDFLASVTGYHSSRPTLTQYYNIPAGVFLPQIERAPQPAYGPANKGRRDGVVTGGAVKLLFGGISGLVTGSYTPHPGHAQNYYSSGSDPRVTDHFQRWNKKNFESRNYVSFIDSFAITSGGIMTRTAGIRNDGTPFTTKYPDDYMPKATGGAPFWRCDTFFLLHQKKGKNRFVGGEFDIITAPEKNSFERLQGETKSTVVGNYNHLNGGTSALTGLPGRYLPQQSHQSAVLAAAAADGLGGGWVGGNAASFTPIMGRRSRIRIEETLNEFTSSARTTNRELITYAQMTHYGYAAAEAVIPGEIIPPENYYVSPSLAEGSQPVSHVATNAPSGIDINGHLLPVSRSFYSQAIKLGATNVGWAQVGSTQLDAYYKIVGPGARSAWGSQTLLYNSTNGSSTPESQYYTTSSDQAKTQYGSTNFPTPGPTLEYGISGMWSSRGTNMPGTLSNPLYLDPGAGSGNGLFWRFSEYDAVGDAGVSSDAYITPYKTGKPFMRQFRWEQWFENPVYCGFADRVVDTSTNLMTNGGGGRWQGFPMPLIGNSQTNAGKTGGNDVKYMKGVPPASVPISLPNVQSDGEVQSGSWCGGKLNYMQIDWRYQCGTHYNSAMDSAPIGLVSGPRYRKGETNGDWTTLAVQGRPSTMLTYPWYAVGGHSPTGSDYIGSMVSSASQPWHGTAITRSGFSLISSPTTPVPSGTHPDLAIFGSFHNPGRNWARGGIGGWCDINVPAYRRTDRYITSSAPVKLSNWLDAGLSRDLDIEVTWKMKHSRTDVNGGEAGFTILTASTVFPPGDLAGRFNGDHKLRATFKERRLLNAGKFRIVSDIKSQPISAGDSSALFVHTAPAKRQYLVGTGAMAGAADYEVNHTTREHGENSRFANDRIWWRAYAIEGGYIGDTQASEWQHLVGNPPQLTSGRRYVAAMAANRPITTYQISGTRREMLESNVPQWAPGPGLFRAGYSANANWNNPFGMVEAEGVLAGRVNQVGVGSYSQQQQQKELGLSPVEWSRAYAPITSASLYLDKPKTSLYLLMPGDEIVLGFQPSLQGGNRGNNTIPMNPNVNPYGPWRDGVYDRQGIPTGSAYNPEWNYALDSARSEKVDSRGQGGYHLRRGPNKVITRNAKKVSINNANMETVYEPRSSFTLKKSRNAKLVLYGTLLRNKKHLPPDSTVPPQRTNVVHQAIMGAPVTDQFQIEPTYAYTGSYIAHHITGNIQYTQRNRYDMALPQFTEGINLLIRSPFSRLSPSYVPLGGPYSVYGEYTRRVYRPNARDNQKTWFGLGLPDADGIAGDAGTTPYWPKAPSTSISMGISGSIQRFVRLSDDSEYYYDSFPPNPSRMWDIDLLMSGGVSGPQISGPSPEAFDSAQTDKTLSFNLGTTSWVYTWSTPWNGGTEATPNEELDERPMWPNPYYLPSFPFEERYSTLKRAIVTTEGLNTSGSRASVFVPKDNYQNALAWKSALAKLSNSGRTFPTGSQALVTSIRIADGVNDRMFEAISWAKPKGNTQAWSGAKKVDNPAGQLNIVMASIFGFWKTEWGDRPLPTVGRLFPNTDTTQIGFTNWAPKAQLDHPSGWKYGLINFRKQSTSAVFRYDRFGQFRDMLEQRQYSRFYDTGDEHTPAGLQEPAVSCIFVDGDGLPLSDPRETSCLNVSSEMTSSVPYKEGETSRTFLFSRQTVTISPLVQSFTASPFLSSLG